jgi:hypothetical protein
MRKLLLFLIMITSAGFVFAQVNVTGILTDVGGVPLIGVNVVEKGTSRGTVMDVDGKFTINAASYSSIRVFSYVL